MLTFEAPFYEVKNVICFRDHADPKQFYYLAGIPKLSVDAHKKPQFTLLKYRNALDAGGATIKNRDSLGGAFLMIGVDCGVDKDSIQGELESKAGISGISLAPVLYTSGSVHIVALDYTPPPPAGAPPPAGGPTPPQTGSHFVKSVIGSSTPSLLGDQHAIFSIALDTDAATLIEDAYEKDMSPIGVIYELQFAGLRPALSVTAEVDYKRVYEMLKIDFHLGVHTGSGSNTKNTATPAATPPATPAATPGATPAVTAGTATAPPLSQAIQIKIQTAGALGTAAFKYLLGAAPITDTTGTLDPTAAPTSTPNVFRWNVPGMTGVQVDFPTGNYVANETYSIAINRQVSRAGIGTAPPASPLISVVAPAGVAVAPPPAVNPTTPTSPTTPPTTNKDTTDTSTTQVGLDVDIDYSMQKLQQSGAIKIKIVRQQEGKSIDDMQKEAMDLIKEDLLKDFFKPAMTTSPAAATPTAAAAQPAAMATTAMTSPGAAGKDSKTKVDIGFQLQEKKEEELKTMTFDYQAQSPETRTHAPNGFFSALISNTNKSEMIQDIKLDDPFFKTVQVIASSIADFATVDLKTVVLDLSYGGTVDEPSVVLSPTFTAANNDPKTFQSFIENGEMSYRYRHSYYFGQNALVGAQTTEYHTDWHTTISRALVVNPPIDVPMLHVYLAQGLIDWELVARVEVTLSYDDPTNKFHAERSYMIDQSFKNDDWIVRLTDPTLTTYSAQHTWILKDNDRRIKGPTVQLSAPQLFIFDPFVDRLPIILQPEIDPASVQRVTIAFHYQDTANQLDVRKLVELAPPYHTTTVYLPLMDLKKRGYSYQTTLFKAGGAAENRPEVSTEQLSIVIADGSAPFDVNVTILGDLAKTNLTGLQVDLRAEPLDGQAPAIQSHLFEPGGDKKWTQRLALRTDRPTHTYDVQTTQFFADKDPVVSDWNQHDSTILVLQPAHLQ